MSAAPVALLDEPDRLRVGLSPIRRRLLERLRQPASATQLASELEMGRQRVNYHLRALEKAKLVHLVEERQRRGCVERILIARAQAFIVDPSVMTAKIGSAGSNSPAPPGVSRAARDKFSAEYLIDAAADVVRDVTRMRAQAEKQGTRLLTFTMQTDISFAEPGDLERFTTAVAEFVTREAAKYHTPGGGRRYRLVIGGHPSPRVDGSGTQKPAAGESHHDRDRDTKEPPATIDRVLVEVLVAAPIETIWKALREKDDIRRWFGWEYAGLEDELDWIVSKGQAVLEEGRVIRIPSMNDFFVLEPRGDRLTVLRVVRSAPAEGPEGKGWAGIQPQA